jgi:ribose transport system permease protein
MSAPAKSVVRDEDTRAVAPPGFGRRIASNTATWVLALDIVLMGLFAVLSDGRMVSPRAIESILLGSTQALLLALGLAMLLGAGFFDLSLGANLVLSSVVAGLTIRSVLQSSPDAVGTAITAGVVAALVTGTLFGIVNGVLIGYLGINSLIATLGSLGVGTGIALLLSGGADVSGLPRELQTGFGQADVGGIPLPTLVAIAATIVLWAVLRFTSYGVNTLAIGSERSAAVRAGINVKRHVLSLGALAGLLAGTAGFIDIARYGSTAIAGHNQDALTAVTAVVIGGTLLEGGRVNIVGAVWGALLAVILQTGLIVIGVPSYWQLIAVGTVLIVAVGLDRLRAQRRPF